MLTNYGMSCTKHDGGGGDERPGRTDVSLMPEISLPKKSVIKVSGEMGIAGSVDGAQRRRGIAIALYSVSVMLSVCLIHGIGMLARGSY